MVAHTPLPGTGATPPSVAFAKRDGDDLLVTVPRHCFESPTVDPEQREHIQRVGVIHRNAVLAAFSTRQGLAHHQAFRRGIGALGIQQCLE